MKHEVVTIRGCDCAFNSQVFWGLLSKLCSCEHKNPIPIIMRFTQQQRQYMELSPLHYFPAAPLFYRHPPVQNTILPHTVQWSAFFLLPGSSYLEPAPCLCPSFCICQFFQIFLENLSLFKTLFFSPIALIHNSVHVVCACVCVHVRTCCMHWILKICTVKGTLLRWLNLSCA